MKTVIEMAREAGLVTNYGGRETASDKLLERYTELVRADERERIKKANAPEIEKVNAHIKSFEAAVADEREACAKACEELFDMEDDSCNEAEQCAEAIRARGNK